MKHMMRFLGVLTALVLLCSCAMAEQTLTLLTVDSTQVTLTLKDGDTCDTPTEESGAIVRLPAHRPGCADVTISVAVADLDGADSLTALSTEILDAIKADILIDYPGGTITEHYTEAGTLYLLVDAGEDYDLHDMFTMYKGFYIDLIQYNEDFSDLTEADDAFLLDIMQGIWTK